MKKVVVASQNPVKLEATKQGFEKMFPGEEFDVIGISVSSGVADQPLSDNETFLGAKNRVDNAFQKVKDADFYVGIEGGIESVNRNMECFAWIVVKSSSQHGKARTGTFSLPKKIIDLLDQGKELGEADDIVFNLSNSKQQNGAVGILTGDLIDRTNYYVHAMLLALIPFKNKELY